MPSELLNCTICPGNKTYSDVSHLLTHIGSKGHLSKLHNLQVLSHQELNAGHQLAIYNQWFQEHGLASLLSERMQQKEQKKQVRMSATPAAVKPRARKSKKDLQQAPVRSAYDALPFSLKQSESDLRVDLLTVTPVRAASSTSSSYPAIPSSPPRHTSHVFEAEEVSVIIKEDPDSKPSPGTPHLKGTTYPGMDLFDAASEAQRKKRNQKKDGSVLRRLERNAALVLPTETVSSATGIFLKRRHMDDLENDSPVEGEEHIPRPTPKRQNFTGFRVRRAKKNTKQTKQAKKRPGRPRKQPKTPSKNPDPVTDDAALSVSRFTPTEDEEQSFKLTFRNMGRKTRKRDSFAIYQDSSPSFGVDGSSELMPSTYDVSSLNQPQLSYPPPAWQQKPQTEIYDPFKLIRERINPYLAFGDVNSGKENLPTLDHSNLHAQSNPLHLQGDDERLGPGISFGNVNRLSHDAVHGVDPIHDNDTFMPVRNPLMAAFQRIKSPKQESFDMGSSYATTFSTRYRQPLFAP